MADDLLGRARALQEQAARVGFDWPHISGVFEKLQEEIGELVEAVEVGDAAQIRHELGDVMFSVVNLSRFLGACASEELEAAGRRFEARFHCMRARLEDQGRAIRDCSPEELDKIWEQVKRECRTTGGPGVV